MLDVIFTGMLYRLDARDAGLSVWNKCCIEYVSRRLDQKFDTSAGLIVGQPCCMKCCQRDWVECLASILD